MSDQTDNDFENDFRDMLGLLRKHGVEFLIVGAHALAVHDQPRATGDLDIWVRANEANAPRIWAALVEFGTPLEGLEQSEWRQPGVGIHIGLPPGRIDILTMISGVTFDEAWPGRIEGTCLGIKVQIIGLDAFIKNKRAAGRDKDLMDLNRIRQKHDGEADYNS